MDITLITLGIMLDISIVVLYQKYMWVSEEKDLKKFDVYLILNKGGHFYAACPRKRYKVCVRLPEECRPMYIDSSSAKNDSNTEFSQDGK